jgi:ribulose-5-phosphate 4-epimerase/fuculose-1-phosphate aldolase
VGGVPVTASGTAREALVAACRHVAARGLSPGGSGSLALRVADQVLVTPTGGSCSRVTAAELALVPLHGDPDPDGPRPTKELELHRAMFRARPDATAVVHLHAPFTVAAACLDPASGGPDGTGPLPPLTPYQVMRLGRLPVAPYAPPGSAELAGYVGELAAEHAVLLLANHGGVTAAAGLDRAVDLAEELEAAARLNFTLTGLPHRGLTAAQVAELRARA